ncbi:MAG TPA: trypsin-like peptidase domain-containing protein [Acidimicrobiales bacterium]|nr:trypsin-like peptidase domain-containing protein [Acidimicrobiales bacterium]
MEGRGAFEELSRQAAAVLETASPSVVGVGGAGSGFVLDGGHVVTNAHNLRGGQSRLAVSFADGRTAEATIAGVDVDGDLAVLAVDAAGAPPLAWTDSQPTVGQVTVGLSRPNRPGATGPTSGEGTGLRAGVGFVTALGVAFRGPGGRTVRGAIEHSAPLAHGSSGGPIVDGEGKLLGINTHRIGDGFYLAIPAAAELRRRLEALSRGEEPRRLRLGVALAPPQVAHRLRRAVGLPEREGVLVHAVEPGGPGERAGIRRGDLIVSVTAGTETATPAPVRTVEELAAALDALAPDAADGGVTAELGVVRGADEMAVSVDFTRTGPAAESSV